MENTYVIIDGNSLINRAYYAMQKPMITKEGIYTQGIFGFLNMLSKIEKEYEPSHISVTFDMHAPTFRHEMYKEYKAGRKHMPPELLMEMPILKDILNAMNISIFELEGYEADDLIGTLSRFGEENGLHPLIVTGDRDQLQLASSSTKVLFTKRGVTEFDLFDDKHFFETYGFKPLQFIDYKGIFGDKSDNIPGIPGIGEKGATELILKFGTVENLIERIDEIEKEGTKKKVLEGKESAILSKKLATINRFSPIEFNLEDVKFKEPNYDELISLYKKLEFNSFLSKLNVKNNFQDIEFDKFNFNGLKAVTSNINDLDVFKGKEVYLKVFSDYNHVNLPFVSGIFVMNQDNAIYYPGFNKSVITKIDSLNLKVFGHGIKNDIYVLMRYGLTNIDVVFDTEIASYVLDSSKSKYGLNEISLFYMHESIVSEEEFISNGQIDMFSSNDTKYMDYGILLAERVFTLKSILEKKIKEENYDELFYSLELPLILVMAKMEAVGIRVDKDYLKEFSVSINEKILEIEKKIFDLAGEEFNIRSTAQLGEILFEKLNLNHSKKNKKGYSTAQEVLEKIKDSHPIIPLILEYRNLTKLKSTYIDSMIPLISSDGYVRAHFNQTVTQTGRISCSDPNLQNIPVRQELGRKLRYAFLPDNGYTFIGADYSQIELRVLAHLSMDDSLISAFKNGEDIHKLTASRVLGIPIEKITPLDRSRAKAVNFGVIYGMSSFGLSEELGISRQDANEYINEYFRKHPKVKEYLDSQISFVKENGYSLTIMGRKRYIPEIKSTNFMVKSFGERLAMNSPIQGSAADIIKIAMIKVYNELKEKFPGSSLILQVHDELIINAKKEDEEGICELLRRNMEEAYSLLVNLDVSMNEADNWYDLK